MSGAKLVQLSPKAALSVVALAGVVALSGCTGPTYGTGVPQSEQTVKDMYNIFALSQPRKHIDYSARPDLVVPENKAELPQPLDESATTSNPNWPESPEQRIARVRAQAGEVDPRTGDYSTEELQRKKEGIGLETSNHKGDFVPGKTDRDGNPILHMEDNSARKQVLQAKAGQTYNCADRRYLTEPPPEYCHAVDTAPQGQDAFTEDELAARKEAKKKSADGVVIPKALSSRD